MTTLSRKLDASPKSRCLSGFYFLSFAEIQVTWTKSRMVTLVLTSLFCSGRQLIEPVSFGEKTAHKAFYLVFSAKMAGGKFAEKNKKEGFDF